jgi:pimeloyl-ACP methyl ester carboxylesterase
MTKQRLVRKVLTISLLAYLGFGAYLYAFQRAFLYYPVGEPASSAAASLWLSTGDVRIRVWVINPEQDAALIYFGGNAEAVIHNADEFTRWFPEYSIYLVNYRGYAGSTGTASEAGLFGDALAVYDDIAARHVRIATLGRSLGTGVAVYLASERPIDRLALVTPFDSVVAVARSLYPIYPVSVMIKDKYDSLSRAPKVTAPTLVLIAEDDTLIPPKHAFRLVTAFAANQVRTEVVANANHFSIGNSHQYRAALRDFFAG